MNNVNTPTHLPISNDLTGHFKPELKIFKAEMSVNIQTSPHPDWSESNTSRSQSMINQIKSFDE